MFFFKDTTLKPFKLNYIKIEYISYGKYSKNLEQIQLRSYYL
jgi:hypothetical protein